MCPRSNPEGGGCINLDNHVRCSTVSQPSINSIPTSSPQNLDGISRPTNSASWPRKTVHNTEKWSEHSAQRCYSRTRLLQEVSNPYHSTNSRGDCFVQYTTVVSASAPYCWSGRHAPISSALCKRLGTRPSRLFNRGIFQALLDFLRTDRVPVLRASSWCAPRITVGHILRRVPLPASSRLHD